MERYKRIIKFFWREKMEGEGEIHNSKSNNMQSGTNPFFLLHKLRACLEAKYFYSFYAKP